MTTNLDLLDKQPLRTQRDWQLQLSSLYHIQHILKND